MTAYWKLALPAVMLVLIAGATVAQNADDQNNDIAQDAIEETPAPPPVHIVERGDLALTVERDGRLESAEKVKVRLVPEAYTGTLEFIEVAHRGGRVSAGDLLFRFDAKWIDDQIRSARESLGDQHTRLAHAQNELAVMLEANARRTEQAEKALADAENALEVWNEYQGPRMLTAADLSLRSSENNLRNQREELEQLEAMYEGVELASETKDIVLERARRQLAVSEQWFLLAQNDRIVTVEHTHPRQDRDVNDAVRFRAEELQHLRINTAIAEARKHAEIEGIERAIRDGEDRLAKLEADRSRLEITAPAAGLLTANDFQKGDTANARQVLGEIANPDSRIIKFNATAADLRVLREGESVRINFPDFPEITVRATVQEIAPIGQAAGDATHFPVVIDVEGDDPMLRLGLRSTVIAEQTMSDVVLVPKKAVQFEAGRAYVTVREDDDAEPARREITIGASNDEWYQVIDGLVVGEVVVLTED